MISRTEDRAHRAKARAAGATYYLGLGCRRCDKFLVERYASTGECRRCKKIYMRGWRAANPEKAAAHLRKHLHRLSSEGRLEGPLVP